MKDVPGHKKRLRKNMRTQRRADLTHGYRNACREEIARLQDENSHAVRADDRVSPQGFRAALRRLRHEFTAAIAGRQVRA